MSASLMAGPRVDLKVFPWAASKAFSKAERWAASMAGPKVVQKVFPWAARSALLKADC